jgi:hypothetical protein
MSNFTIRRTAALLACIAMSAVATPALPQTQASATVRDGSHDMDFNFGTWHTEITRYPDPIGKPNETVHMAGTVTVRPVWNGKAQMEEIEADGPSGHWQGGTLFLYDPQARQWSQNFVAASVGRFDEPPTIGEYRDGNIEYYSQENFHGRATLIRGIWSDIKPDSHSYEEDFSSDGGRTWHPAFVGHLTRIGR